GTVCDTARFYTLIPTAQTDKVTVGGKCARALLGEGIPRRSGDDENSLRINHIVEGLPPRFGFHHHARATAIWSVINGAMPIMGVFAQIADGQINQAARTCFTR